MLDLLSHATAFLLGLLIIAHSILLCIDLVCSNELIVLLDVEGGSNMPSKEMLVACLIELSILFFQHVIKQLGESTEHFLKEENIKFVFSFLEDATMYT